MIDGRDAALGADLDARVAAQARMADALVELDRHPGHALLTRSGLTGETARRWAAAEEALAGLWRDFATHRAVLDAAGTAHRRGDPAEVSRLLHGRSIEDVRTAVPLRERGLTGAAERVGHVDLDTLAARMERAFAQVGPLVDDAWSAHERALARVAALAEQLGAARGLSVDLGAEQAALADLTRRLDALERAATSDPLGPAQEPEVLQADVRAVTARLRDLVAARDGWPDRATRLDRALAELDALRRRLDEDRARAVERVVTVLPAPPADRRAELAARRDAVASMPGWRHRATAATALGDALAAETAALHAAHALVTGLLERREELRGRHHAFRAKAQRLGRAELPETLRLEDELRAALWTRPADLAAATRALAAYQHLLRESR